MANDGLLRSGLTDLLLQALARIPYTFILVGIGRTEGAHFSRHLSNLLTIDSRQRDPGLLGVDRGLDAGGQRVFNGMRISEAEHHHSLALHLSAIANAND